MYVKYTSFSSFWMIFLTMSQGRSWMVRRSYEDFRVLDKHLHLCIYDRRFSQLPELPRYDSLRERAEVRHLTYYLRSALPLQLLLAFKSNGQSFAVLQGLSHLRSTSHLYVFNGI